MRVIAEVLVALALAAPLAGPVDRAPMSGQPEPAAITLSPTSGPVGTAVTIKGSGFSPRDNVARFGRGFIKNLPSTDGRTIRFTIPDGLDLCPPDASGPCPGAYPPVTPGEYAIAVKTGDRTTGTATFTVTR